MYKALDKWFYGWMASTINRSRHTEGKKHLLFCIADHFEPFRKKNGHIPSPAEANKDVSRWLHIYQQQMSDFRDSDGRLPRHTFFYPAEEYDKECLDQLAACSAEGRSEVEIQLHHRNDTPEGFIKKISSFRDTLKNDHRLLGTTSSGEAGFGFVHGNWALCNSRPDGDWCGVNEELGLLSQLNCYADFTFPSAPSPTQPRMVNAIYRACDTPGKPRGADRGEKFKVQDSDRKAPGISNSPSHPGLPLITGPLGLRWKGCRPGLENGALTAANPPTPARTAYWAKRGIGVIGRPDWIFVKVYMHGITELAGSLLTEELPAMHATLRKDFNDGSEWNLHYVSAREMYNIARAAESGKSGNPGDWRDFEISRPECIK